MKEELIIIGIVLAIIVFFFYKNTQFTDDNNNLWDITIKTQANVWFEKSDTADVVGHLVLDNDKRTNVICHDCRQVKNKLTTLEKLNFFNLDEKEVSVISTDNNNKTSESTIKVGKPRETGPTVSIPVLEDNKKSLKETAPMRNLIIFYRKVEPKDTYVSTKSEKKKKRVKSLKHRSLENKKVRGSRIKKKVRFADQNLNNNTIKKPSIASTPSCLQSNDFCSIRELTNTSTRVTSSVPKPLDVSSKINY